MTQYVAYLDELALLSDSSLVELQHPAFELRVTPTITKALWDPANTHPMAPWAREKLEAAINEHRVVATIPDLSTAGILPGVVAPYADLLTHAYLTKISQPNSSVVVVTTDSKMPAMAASAGLMSSRRRI